MLTLQAPSSSLNAGAAKGGGGQPGPRRGFLVPSGSLLHRTAASIYTLQVVDKTVTEFASRRELLQIQWETDFYPVQVLGGVVLSL